MGDSGKGLTIRYNPLHLPWEASSNEGLLQFDHTYGGEKVRKVLSGTEGSHERLYLGGLEYVDGALEACYHGEGRVLLTGEGPRWQYRIADHLGNLAVLFEDRDGDGTITDEEDTSDPAVLEVLQRHFYYPFGMAMEGGWAMQAEHPNRYLYNGKELEGGLGLGWYFYGARMHDPAIGRFTGVDPLADRFAHVSVYNYAENEPIANIDLHGLQKVSINDIKSGGQVHRRDVNVSVNMKVINLSSRDDFRFNTGLRKAPPVAAREFRTSFKQRIVTDPKVGLSSNEVSVNVTFTLSVEQVSHLNQVSDKDHVMMIVDKLDVESRAFLGGNVGLIDASRLDLGSDVEVLLHELGHNLDFNFHELGGDEHSGDGKGLMGANINGQTDVPKEVSRDMYLGLGSGAAQGQHFTHGNTRENARTFLKNHVKKYDETKAKTKGF